MVAPRELTQHTDVELPLLAVMWFPARYACWSCMVSVKTGRRAWTLVGYIWDGMFPLAFLVRYWRTKRDKKFLCVLLMGVLRFLGAVVSHTVALANADLGLWQP